MSIKTFYSFKRILSHNCVLNFVPGGRGIGKSYGAKKIAIGDALTSDSQFIYMRRYVEELDEARGLFFDDIAHEWPEWEFDTTKKLALATRRLTQLEDESEAEFNKRLKARTWKKIGHFISLSTTQRYKSTPFPFVKWIIVDEFILEKGATQYLRNEATIMLNFVNTVERMQDRVRVLLLANAVSINNPYFLKWKIRPSSDGKIQVKAKDKTGLAYIAVDFPDSEQFKKEAYASRFGRFIEGTEYAAYAVENIFVDNGGNMIKTKDSEATYVFSLETLNDTFSIWYVRKPGVPTVYYIQARQPGTMKLFTMVPDRMNIDRSLIRSNNKMLSILREAYDNAKCYFDVDETRNAFIDIFEK